MHTLYLSDHVIQLPVNHSLVAQQAVKRITTHDGNSPAALDEIRLTAHVPCIA
jgi:hypothetical protein